MKNEGPHYSQRCKNKSKKQLETSKTHSQRPWVKKAIFNKFGVDFGSILGAKIDPKFHQNFARKSDTQNRAKKWTKKKEKESRVREMGAKIHLPKYPLKIHSQQEDLGGVQVWKKNSTKKELYKRTLQEGRPPQV